MQIYTLVAVLTPKHQTQEQQQPVAAEKRPPPPPLEWKVGHTYLLARFPAAATAARPLPPCPPPPKTHIELSNAPLIDTYTHTYLFRSSRRRRPPTPRAITGTSPGAWSPPPPPPATSPFQG